MNTHEATAMVFETVQKPFRTMKVALPQLNEGDILVEVSYATICTSDLHTYFGRRCSHAPSVLGHEVIGSIVALPEGGSLDYDGKTLTIGDRVTWSVYAHDHEGDMAARGIPQKSPGLFKYGHEQITETDTLSGGFATHCHLRAGTDTFKIPSTISDKEAAPLNCTHATVAGAIRLAGDLSGKNVLVTGAGMLGITACAMAKYAGAKLVWAMDVDETRNTKAKSFGADAGINSMISLDELKVLTGRYGSMDVVIDTSGVAEAMEKGIALLNIGGVAVWAGAVYTERKTAIDAESIVRSLITIKGLHNYTPADLAYAIKFLESAKNHYPFEALVEEDYLLSQLEQAFQFANNSKKYRVGIKPDPHYTKLQ